MMSTRSLRQLMYYLMFLVGGLPKDRMIKNSIVYSGTQKFG